MLVRTAANVDAGGRTRMSSVMHGALLLLSVVLLPGILRLTPLAALATILIIVGFKLTKPSLYKKVYSQGWDQFLPFIITVLAVVGTDLLTGCWWDWCAVSSSSSARIITKQSRW